MSALPPDPPRPSAGVDPSAVQDAAGFAAALTELRAQVALTIREVSRRTGIPSATLGGYFSGRHLPPPTQPAQLVELLTALGVPPEQHEEWRLALNRVRRIPGPRTAAGKVTPYRGLESYGVRDAAWFVGREHFVDQLQAEVGGLFDADGPRLVTLVGASGTGKSSLLRAGLMARLAMEGVTPVLLTPGSDPQRSLAAALARFRPDTRKRLVVVDQLEEVFYDDVSPAVREEFLTAIIALADEDATVVVTALRADFYGHAVEGPTLLPVLRRHQVLVGPMDPDSLRRVVVEPARRAGATVEPELVELVLRDLSPRGAAPDASALPMMSHALLATWKQARNARLRVSDYVAVGGVAGAVQRTAEQVYGSLDEDGRATARWLFSQLVNVDEDGVATRRRVETRDLAQRDALTPVIEAFVAGRILTATDHTLEISHEVLLTVWPRLGEWLTADREVLRLRRRIGLAAQAWEESGREPEGLLRGTLLDLARPLFDDPSPRLTALERSFVAESLAHEADIVRVQRRRALGMRSLFAVVAALALIATTLSIYLVQAVGEADEQRVAAEQARNRALSRQVAVQASKLQETAPTLASQLSLAAYELAPTVEARSGLLSSTGGTQVSRLVGPEGTMAAVASLDGRIIATVHSDGVVRFWAAAGGAAPTQVAELPAAEGGELYAAAFSPDGRLFATAGAAGVVTVVDMGDPSRPVAWSEPLTGPESAVHSLAFSSNGRTLYAGTSDPALFRWVLGSGERSALQRPVTRFGGPVQSVATSSTGLVAAGSADGFVRVWRIKPTGLSPVYRLSVGAPTNFVHSVAFSPDGRLLAAGAKDKRVRVWRMHSGNLVTDELGGFTSWVNSVAFSQDGHALAAGASGGLVRVWRTRAWLPARSLQGPTNFTSVQFVPSGDVLTGSIDGSARIYHLAGPQLPPFGDNVWGVATPASGDLVYVGVGSGDPQVARIGVMNPGSPHVGVPLLAPASAGALDGVVGVSPDGSTVAAGTATGQVVVWNVAESGERTLVAVLETATQLIENIAFSADGSTFAASSDDGSTTVYAIDGSAAPSKLSRVRIDSLAMGVALSPDSSLLAVGGADNLVHLWRLDGSAVEDAGTLEGFKNYVPATAFSPDGQVLAAGSADGTVRLWDVTSKKAPAPVGKPLVGATDTVFGIAWDPSGERLAAASADGTLWLWSFSPDGGALYARLGNLGGGVYQAAFHPSGRVFGGGASGQVTSWVTDVAAAKEEVCRTAGAPISEEEWEQYVPGVAYDPPCT